MTADRGPDDDPFRSKRPRRRKEHPTDDRIYMDAFQIAGEVARRLVDGDSAEDVAQSVATRLWDKVTRGLLPPTGPANLRAYVGHAVRTEVIELRRARTRRCSRELRHESGLATALSEWMSPVNGFELEELKRALNRAIARMGNARRKMFELIYDDGLTQQEVATRLGVSSGTVGNQVARALEKLQGIADAHRKEGI